LSVFLTAEGYNAGNNQFTVFNKEELESSYSPSGNTEATEEKNETTILGANLEKRRWKNVVSK
jgi:hypothetical protein